MRAHLTVNNAGCLQRRPADILQSPLGLKYL